MYHLKINKLNALAFHVYMNVAISYHESMLTSIGAVTDCILGVPFTKHGGCCPGNVCVTKDNGINACYGG